MLENSWLSEYGISRELMCVAQVTGVLGKVFSQHTLLVTWANERKFLDIAAKPSELIAAVCTHLVGSRRTTCLSKKARTCSGIFLWLLEKFAAWKQYIWAATFWTEKGSGLVRNTATMCLYFFSFLFCDEGKRIIYDGKLVLFNHFRVTLRCLRQLGGVKHWLWFK